MRKRLLKVLMCPNNKVGDFKLFAQELKRAGSLLCNLDHNDIHDDDDVKTGFIYNDKTDNVYIITQYILSFLSDQDADYDLSIRSLKNAIDYAPESLRKIIKKNIKRLKNCNNDNDDNWAKEEIAYYNKEVDTEEERKNFYEECVNNPLWHIYLERKQLFNRLNLSDINNVLEVGCGNARTVHSLFSPSKYHYNYVGIDISLKRLMLAKMVITEGDFVQCSTLNLPFKNEAFSVVIAFGTLHHLSDPMKGLKSCIKKLGMEGYFLIQEPIKKPFKLLPEEKFYFLKKVFTSYEHSKHDNDIDLRDTLELLKNENMIVKYTDLNASCIRTILSKLFEMFPIFNRHKLVWKTAISIDHLFIKLFCFKHNRLGPGGVLLLSRKIIR